MTLLLVASLFFTEPVVPDLPRADAFLEEDDVGTMRLVDRYNVLDLWRAQRRFGRWLDADGRQFALCALEDIVPPLWNEGPKTRVAFEAERVRLEKDDLREFARAVQALIPVPIAACADDWTKPHQLPRTCREVRYCEGTNANWIVAAFLPRKSSRWLLATWKLAEEDDREEFRRRFEDEFLLKRLWEGRVSPEPSRERKSARAPEPRERDLLRRDLAHSVTNYPRWRVTDSPGFVILDELGSDRAGFVARLTNELVTVRGDYAKAVPSPIDGSNTLAVARLYAARKDYLRAAGPEMAWSAAYWCQERREIVAHLPEDGEDALLRTLRHEGFHQYLAYAGSMLLSAPWINEGYAEYFEIAGNNQEEDRRIDALHDLAISKPDDLRADLVKLLALDYGEFYDGDRVRCAFNYLLAWSVAFFLEQGAPEVRFRPFANLTRDYMAALLKTRDRARATENVFKTETLELFVSEWLKFYKDL